MYLKIYYQMYNTVIVNIPQRQSLHDLDKRQIVQKWQWLSVQSWRRCTST